MTEEEKAALLREEERLDAEYKEERKQRNARAWKESKDIFKIVIPILIVSTFLIRMYFDHLIEETRKERELEVQQIEAELDAEEAAEKAAAETKANKS